VERSGLRCPDLAGAKGRASAWIAPVVLLVLAWTSGCLGSQSTSMLGDESMGETRFRGVNVVLEMADELDLEHLACKWNANLIRLCIGLGDGWGYFRPWPRTAEDIKEEDLQKLDKVIDACEDLGIRVLIDVHQWLGYKYLGEGEDTVAFWSNAQYQAALLDFWEMVAARYADRGDVIYGYDILNEPHSDAAGPEFAAKWQAFAETTVAAIRNTDTRHAVIVEASEWANPPGFEYLRPIEDSNIIYSFHMWVPHQFTHQGVAQTPTGIPYPYPAKSWDKEWLREQIEPVIRFQEEHGVRILAGEFCAMALASESDRASYIRDCLELFEEYGFDYAQWCYSEWGGWSLEHAACPSVDEGAVCYKGRTESLDVFLDFLGRNQPARECGPRATVLIDQTDWSQNWETLCASDLVWRAVRCFDVHPHSGVLTEEALDGASVVFVGAVRKDMMPSEISLLEEFVGGGRGLLVYGSSDHEWFNNLLGSFGIEANPTPVCARPYDWDPSSYRLKDLGDHSISEGCIDFHTNWTGSVVSAPHDSEFLWTPDTSWRDVNYDGLFEPGEPRGPFPLAAAVESGEGRVVYIAEDRFGVPNNYEVTFSIMEWLLHPRSEDTDHNSDSG